MKVVLLGTGGYFPTPRRQTACVLLPEVGVTLDAGTGMHRIGKYLQSDRLDIFLSHAHLDHVAGLTYLINVVPQQILPSTVVHGDTAVLAAVRDHLFAKPIFPVAPAFRFSTIAEECPLPHGGTLTPIPLKHPGGSLGFRLDWPGHSLAYITDTTATENAAYADYIRGVDLLLHECYFADDANNWPAITGHSALTAVARLAAAAEPRRVVLLHIDPLIEAATPFELSAARELFPEIALGNDLDELEF